ncbi:MAG: SMC-Scp complex subunit ScpB, partial [Cycloclasticus pugetii]
KEVPGRPALYATTKAFLDYFNLQTLADLPPLATLLEADLLSSNELQLNLGDDTPINKDITQDEKQQPT